MTQDKKPIQLPESKQKTCSGENFGGEPHTCNSKNEYEDILYVTGSDCFWLVSEKSAKLINQAVSDFKKKVFTVSTGGEMIPKLAEAGCDLFISINPAVFLEGQDKSRWEELESYRKQTQEKLDKNYENILKEDEQKTKNRQPLTAHPLDMVLYKEVQKMYAQQKELDRLTEKGFQKAESIGYLVDRKHHEIFDPRQKKIKQALDSYISNSALFSDRTKTPDKQINDVKSYLDSLCELNKKIRFHSPDLDQEMFRLTTQLTKLQSGLKNLLIAISELAGLGIAMPEYALAGVHNLDQGADAYATWFSYLAEKEKFKHEMDAQLAALKVGTDRGPMPPSEAFQRVLQNMAKQQEKADTLYQKALEACKKHEPQMLLLWEPKGYQIPKVKCIANPSYPLREIVTTQSPEGKKKIRTDYFSLNDIPRVIKKARPKFPYHVDMREGDPELEEILKPYGVMKLPLRRSWFNDRGFFVPDEFYKDTIHHKNVDTRIKIKKLESNKSAWEKNITRFLFRDIVEQMFSPVDESASGVFCRVVADGVKTTTLKTETSRTTDAGHPDNKKKDSTKQKKTYFSLSQQTDFTFLRGEFELVNHTFPENPQAYLLPVTYKARDANDKEIAVQKFVPLGAWSFHAVVKCFGFIGATIKLSSNLYGETPVLVPGDTTVSSASGSTKTVGGTIEGFVGAQIGASLTGELLWQPPDNVKKQMSPAAKYPLAIGTINLVAMAGAGASMKLPLEIKYQNGKLDFNIKPSFWGGLGFNLAMSSEINVAGMCMLIEIFQDILKTADYHQVDAFDKETFTVLSNYSLVMLLIAPWAAAGVVFGKGMSYQQAILEVGLLAAKGKTFLEDIIALFKRSENAGLIAYSLTGHLVNIQSSDEEQITAQRQTETAIAKWTRLLTPESFGHLLGALITEPNKDGMKIGDKIYSYNQLKAMQQLTIARLLAWLWNHQQCSATNPIADQRRYQEAISRMFKRNVGNNAQQKQAYCQNIHKLDPFMLNTIELDKYEEKSWIQQYKTYMNSYPAYRKQLSLHLSDWENAKLTVTPIAGLNNMAETEWK